MLNRIRLINYRCFEDSEIWLKKLTLFVGSNNAGKSTLTEALRIIGFAIRKFQNTSSYSQAPRNLNLPARTVGVNIKAEEHKIELKTVVHLYKEDTYAEIIASFGKKIRIHVYLTSEYIFAVLEADGNIINKKTDALKLEGLSLHVMPQLRLIHEEEQRLSQETVARGMETRLSSIHFRNEIYQYREQYFEVFKETAERTWPGLRIQEIHHDINENKITLIVFDSGYSAEIGMMGSGLQMWLQIVWFICHNAESSSVVLDEPDVYMHPDLQRKILDIVRNRFAQVIIATHSVEMISDVDADQIITIDKKSRKMGYADSYRAVQDIVNNLGSIHNLSLTRLGVARKCVFVEGEDMKILARFQRALRMDSPISIDQLPTIRLGGWTRFSEALGAARLFYNETKGEIKTYCILDKDYHTQEEITELYKKAEENHLHLHVWSKKELENYIITPESVFRFLGLPQEKYAEFVNDMSEAIAPLYEQTLCGIVDNLFLLDKSQGAGVCTIKGKDILDKEWANLEGRLSIANGKDIISVINDLLRKKYNRSCSQTKLLNALTKDDVSEEIRNEIAELLYS